MRVEYEAIVDGRLQLQIDAPDLAMGRHIMYRDRSDEEFLDASRCHIEALNHALRDIPAERVRLHLCWGNYEGPHHLDIAVEKIIGVILRAQAADDPVRGRQPAPRARVGGVARHARSPTTRSSRPGVIDYDDQLHRAPRAGRAAPASRTPTSSAADRVIAGTDCGFGTWAGFGAIDPDICWAKLRTLTEGAALADKHL